MVWVLPSMSVKDKAKKAAAALESEGVSAEFMGSELEEGEVDGEAQATTTVYNGRSKQGRNRYMVKVL